MTHAQWRKAQYLAKRVWNGPRYAVEAAWNRLTQERTRQDVHRLSYDLSWYDLVKRQCTAGSGWGQLIAARA